eukprot:1235698-Alexandrium_andersonii.AAC.1
MPSMSADSVPAGRRPGGAAGAGAGATGGGGAPVAELSSGPGGWLGPMVVGVAVGVPIGVPGARIG